jgi:hypothetical protein
MTRNQKLLAIPLAAGLALAVGGLRHCPSEPPPVIAVPDDSRLADPYPETVPLRVFAKRLIADDVAAGRRSLVEAAAMFGVLNRLPPALPDYPPAGVTNPDIPIPTSTADERLCWQVVSWVRSVLAPRPREADAAAARLAAEFRGVLRSGGVLRLPDPSSLESPAALMDRAREAQVAARRPPLVGHPRPIPNAEAVAR